MQGRITKVNKKHYKTCIKITINNNSGFMPSNLLEEKEGGVYTEPAEVAGLLANSKHNISLDVRTSEIITAPDHKFYCPIPKALAGSKRKI
jgi:hypothetical protein